jgi:hypothetical protein
VGSDGHVEVEAGTDGSCTSLEEFHDESSAEEDHCGSCLDIPLDAGTDDECHTYVPIAKLKLQKPSLIAIPWIVQSSEIQRPVTIACYMQSTQAPETLRCIRSIHLLL